MMHSIAVANTKGGTGKTTTALNLSVALAEMGRTTLLFDLDPQGAIGLSLARSDTEWRGLAELVMDQVGLDEVLIQTKLPGLSILPRGRLDPTDICAYESVLYASERLGQILRALEGRFQYAIVDTPSGLGMVTRAALAVCTHVLIPFQAEPLALRSISQVLRVVDHVRQNENPNLKLVGILPTMVQLQKDASLNVMSTIWSGFGGVLDSIIPRSDVFAVASEKGLPISFLAGKTPPEARRFDALATEVDTIVAEQSGVKGEPDGRPQRQLV